MTQMNFFNSNFFNLKLNDLNPGPRNGVGTKAIELGKKKADVEVFGSRKDIESPKGLKKFKEDFFPSNNYQNGNAGDGRLCITDGAGAQNGLPNGNMYQPVVKQEEENHDDIKLIENLIENTS